MSRRSTTEMGVDVCAVSPCACSRLYINVGISACWRACIEFVRVAVKKGIGEEPSNPGTSSSTLKGSPCDFFFFYNAEGGDSRSSSVKQQETARFNTMHNFVSIAYQCNYESQCVTW